MSDKEKLIEIYKSKGYNLAQIAGIMANHYKEAAYNPRNLQQNGERKLGMSDDEYTAAVDNGSYSNFVKDGYGYGLVQWTHWERKQDFYKYMKKRGLSVGDMQGQIDFMFKEMAYSSYSAFVKVLNAASETEQGAYDVAYSMCKVYECPADTETRAKERGEFAKELFHELKKDHYYVVVDCKDDIDAEQLKMALEFFGRKATIQVE